jgi:thiol-disulfide isomerase/thioredoxin
MRRLLAATLAGVLLLSGCSTGDDAVLSGGQAGFVAPGGKVRLSYPPGERQAFEISGDDLMHEGQRLSTKDYPGKVVVVNVWGQWCGPCRAEVPELQKVHEAGKAGGWTVLGVDVRDESREAPQDFLRDREISYPSIFDPPGRSLLALRGVPRNVVPMTVVLDKRHRVANVFLTDLLAEDLLPVVRRLAAE